jgi:hypothetical protein
MGSDGPAVADACYPCRILKSSVSGSGGISGIFGSSGSMWSHGWAREAKMSAAGSNRLGSSMLPACTRTSRGLWSSVATTGEPHSGQKPRCRKKPLSAGD